MAQPLVTLRPYPDPYQAALTICSDLDYCTPEDFLAIHRFLNTTRVTPWGPGVGLEIADTFWLYRAAGQSIPGFSYFEGTSATPGPWAPTLRDFLRAGFIDTLHAYGDFSLVGGFRRALAEQGVRALRDEGLTVPVWTNHGDQHNFQNLAEPWSFGDVPRTRSADGDEFAAAEYHWDLTRQLGVEFIWRSVDLTQVWGQERPLRLRDVLTWERWQHPRTAWRWWAQQQRLRGAQFWRNPVLEPVTLRDGSRVTAFKRYGRFAQDRADDVGAMLSESRLAALVSAGATAVLYTHLGKRQDPDGLAVPLAAQAGLRRLADWAQRGKIWVTTTSRLLRYFSVREGLAFQATREGEWVHIRITSPVPAAHLAGLTFMLDRARPAKVWLGERELSCRAHTDDQTGQGFVTVPWLPLASEALARYWDQAGSERR